MVGFRTIAVLLGSLAVAQALIVAKNPEVPNFLLHNTGSSACSQFHNTRKAACAACERTKTDSNCNCQAGDCSQRMNDLNENCGEGTGTPYYCSSCAPIEYPVATSDVHPLGKVETTNWAVEGQWIDVGLC